MNEKSLNESIISIRVKLQNSKLKKTGKNKYAGFDYFELSDFLPKLNELMLEEKINDVFVIEENIAKLTLKKGEESQEYKIPFVMFETPLVYKKDKDGNFIKNKNNEYIQIASMQDIQYLGALNTYYKRYLYLNAFGITDGEIIDGMNNDDLVGDDKNKTKKETKATPKQVALLLQYYQGDNLSKLLDANKISKIEELPLKKASELIKAINEKGKKENE